MLEYRAAVQQQLREQESQKLRRKEQRREQVLDRLWEIAKLPAEVTRGSITGQVKAISMIVAIEGLVPDRRARSAETNSVPPPTQPDIYAASLRDQQGKTIDPQPDPAIAEEEEPGLAEPEPAPASAADAPPPPAIAFDPSDSAFANRLSFSETTPPAPHAFMFVSAPDTRVPFSIKRTPLPGAAEFIKENTNPPTPYRA
jgi:hypothetical protein